MNMNILERFSDTPYGPDTIATLSYEDGCDVFHYLDDHTEDAVNETKTVAALAELIVSIPSVSLEYSDNSILDDLKNESLLATDISEKEDLKQIIQETISETFFEYNWVTYSTEHYDYKRGFTTVSATVKVNLLDLKDFTEEDLAGWRIEVPTDNGTVILN